MCLMPNQYKDMACSTYLCLPRLADLSWSSWVPVLLLEDKLYNVIKFIVTVSVQGCAMFLTMSAKIETKKHIVAGTGDFFVLHPLGY